MCHEWSAVWWCGLQNADEQLALPVRAAGCSYCGGRLDRADYPRKPRGVPEAAEQAFGRRISFCCSREGCRRRTTPASLRFFGRRVYVAAVVVLAGLSRLVQVPARTERRWLAWWRTDFAGSAQWKLVRGFLQRPIATGDLPGALLTYFGGPTPTGVRALLGCLATLQGHVP